MQDSARGDAETRGLGDAGTRRRDDAVMFTVSPCHRLPASLVLALVLLLVSYTSAVAQPQRLVVIKCDGLPYDMVDKLARQHDSQSGKSVLPWIDHIFYQRGARLSNFYVRGMSLSAPSWSLLETGQHLQIKGNVEFDRYTLRSYDYLNFFPLYIGGIVGARVDMPAVEILDSLGVPLLVDAYAARRTLHDHVAVSARSSLLNAPERSPKKFHETTQRTF